jgi:hypothetical protein
MDSTVRMLKLVERLDPENPQGQIELMRVYVEQDMLDSADAARRAAEAVETADSAMDRRRRTAHYAIIRAYRQRVLADPASARSAPTRSQLESVAREISGDSTVLASMNADVERIRATGAKLDAASLRAFQAESTSRSNRLGQAHARRDSLSELASADSTALERVLEPAIAAYEEFLDGGMHVEAGAELAGLYAYRGDAAAVEQVTERIVAEAADTRESMFFLAGNSLLSAGQPAAAARLLATGLAKNPYHRNGLYLLARAHIARSMPDSGLAVARTLTGVDPLNDQPLRLVALAYDRLGEADSARAYQTLADSGLITLPSPNSSAWTTPPRSGRPCETGARLESGPWPSASISSLPTAPSYTPSRSMCQLSKPPPFTHSRCGPRRLASWHGGTESSDHRPRRPFQWPTLLRYIRWAIIIGYHFDTYMRIMM